MQAERDRSLCVDDGLLAHRGYERSALFRRALPDIRARRHRVSIAPPSLDELACCSSTTAAYRASVRRISRF